MKSNYLCSYLRASPNLEQNLSKCFRSAALYKNFDNVVNDLFWGFTHLIDIDAPDYRIDVDRTLWSR
ncbi:hypothetical protein BGZ47_010726 [Haplosporangium gracile]|nr:hypothetical protein BGZ47_010726 [Haplosporangium gracile]